MDLEKNNMTYLYRLFLGIAKHLQKVIFVFVFVFTDFFFFMETFTLRLEHQLQQRSD